jgi:type IV secretory pathway VirB10-like protein
MLKKYDDLLSADTSPQQLNTSGVKRVNNMPLVLVMSILTIFIILIALVAHKRASMQKHMPETIQFKTQKKNTMSLADEVVHNHKSTVIPVKNQPEIHTTEQSEQREQSEQSSIAPKKNWDEKNVPDANIEQIRQEKMQAFTEAINAKTSVVIDHIKLNNSDNSNRENHQVGFNFDTNPSNPEPLLQNAQHARPNPQNLAGEENSMRWHLNSTLENPNSRYELRTGNVIPGVMISGISSELPGQIIGQVSQNVYDTATGSYLLIPQGTRLIGIYSSDVSFGQDSVLIAWQRLIFPDGKALDIGSMPGADSAGLAGFRDQVNHHYAKIYGSALLMSGIVGGIAYSQNINQSNKVQENVPTASSVLSQALGQQLGEVTSQLISKNLNVSPTIKIRPGYRFNVIVVKDLTFNQPYQQFASVER